MKFFAKRRRSPEVPQATDAKGEAAQTVGRRGLVVGSGVAGAAALAAMAMPRGGVAPAAVAQAGTGVDAEEGYRLTEHVKRYYETTRT